MPRTEHSGNQEFGPLAPPSGKRRKEEGGAIPLLAGSRDLRAAASLTRDCVMSLVSWMPARDSFHRGSSGAVYAKAGNNLFCPAMLSQLTQTYFGTLHKVPPIQP